MRIHNLLAGAAACDGFGVGTAAGKTTLGALCLRQHGVDPIGQCGRIARWRRRFDRVQHDGRDYFRAYRLSWARLKSRTGG